MNLYLSISMKRLGVHISRRHVKKGDFSVQKLIEDEETLRNLLLIQKSHSHGDPNLTIVGTLFGKRYSVLPIVFFDKMVLSGMVIDASPENIFVKVTKTGGIRFFIHPRNIVSRKSLSKEQEQKLLHTLVADHLTPLFEKVCKIANCKVPHLQSLVSHNLYQRSHFLQSKFPDSKITAEDVLRMMTGAELFQNQRNPLDFTFRKAEGGSSTAAYIRKHCCLAYLQHEGDKSHCCSTCPHIHKK
ncbi:hypothetical protein ACQCVK_21135 [Rossellomorea vietnamensis]|uniref:Uncharacterized protein n=1 Tax=Rossellomorea aquimaris TaxID=189382 RepID=A0A5D4TXG6_9BACI|nr:hypothetical protein [Rossellomorea aquimaris]TYS79636.1 hypothetical protein FZC80_08265 [Rossellomorea aquimaris]